MITTRRVTYTYGDRQVFQYPDIRCAAGESILITGQSGCGKTTLLHLLCGLLRPVSGAIQVNGMDIAGLRAGALDTFRGRHMGIVFQRAHFVSSLTVKENIVLAARDRKADTAAVLNSLQIGHLAGKLPGTLSLGEQQRVAIARAIINKPVLLLADEPTSSLDDENAARVIRLLQQQAALAGSALIIVTHDSRLKQVVPVNISLS